MTAQEDLDRGDVIEDVDEVLEEGEEKEQEEEEGQPSEESEDELKDEGGEEEDNRVPLSRLNQVLAQRDHEKERTQWLESQLEKLIEQGTLPKEKEDVGEPFDFISAESKYIDLILDGEVKDAAELRGLIDEARSDVFSDELSSVAEKARDDAKTISQEEREQDRFDAAIENFENKYEFLDSESDEYNQEAIETVNALMVGFMQNESKSKALKRAVERVAPMYASGTESTSNRKKASRKKNVDASKRTPPKIPGKGTKELDLDSIDVEKMPESDFNKLSAREKAILRGDAL